MIPGVIASAGSGGGGDDGLEHRYWRTVAVANSGHASLMAVAGMELREWPGGLDMASAHFNTADADSFLSPSALPASNAFNRLWPDGWRTTYPLEVAGFILDQYWAPPSFAFVGSWLSIDLGVPKRVRAVEIRARPTTSSESQTMRDFTLQYSDDNTNWVTVETLTGPNFTSLGQSQEYVVTGSPAQSRIEVGSLIPHAVLGSRAGAIRVNELDINIVIGKIGDNDHINISSAAAYAVIQP